MRILAIDPGPTESAYVLYDVDAAKPIRFAKLPNEALLDNVVAYVPADLLAMEMIASYGMPVGAEVFETCVWIGRFVGRWGSQYRMVYRKQVKQHLCGQDRAKDANVRQALLDKFGPGKELAVGRKATPGPLYGLHGDCWSALGVAVTAAETLELPVH